LAGRGRGGLGGGVLACALALGDGLGGCLLLLRLGVVLCVVVFFCHLFPWIVVLVEACSASGPPGATRARAARSGRARGLAWPARCRPCRPVRRWRSKSAGRTPPW